MANDEKLKQENITAFGSEDKAKLAAQGGAAKLAAKARYTNTSPFQKLTDLNKFIGFEEPNPRRPFTTLELAIELAESVNSKPKPDLKENEKLTDHAAQYKAVKKFLLGDKSKNLSYANYTLIRNSLFDFIKIHENSINYKATQYNILETLCDVGKKIIDIDNRFTPNFKQYFDLKEKYEDEELFCLPHKFFTGYTEKVDFEVYDAMNYRLLNLHDLAKVQGVITQTEKGNKRYFIREPFAYNNIDEYNARISEQDLHEKREEIYSKFYSEFISILQERTDKYNAEEKKRYDKRKNSKSCKEDSYCYYNPVGLNQEFIKAQYNLHISVMPKAVDYYKQTDIELVQVIQKYYKNEMLVIDDDRINYRELNKSDIPILLKNKIDLSVEDNGENFYFVKENFNYSDASLKFYEKKYSENYILIDREYKEKNKQHKEKLLLEGKDTSANFKPPVIKTKYEKFFKGYIQTTNELIIKLRNNTQTRIIQEGEIKKGIAILQALKTAINRFPQVKREEEHNVSFDEVKTSEENTRGVQKKIENYQNLLDTYQKNKTYFLEKDIFEKQILEDFASSEKTLNELNQTMREIMEAGAEKRKNAIKNFFIMFFTIIASVLLAVLSFGTGTGAVISLSIAATIALTAVASTITIALVIVSVGESCGWNFKKVTWDVVCKAMISIAKTIVSAIPGLGMALSVGLNVGLAALETVIDITKKAIDGNLDWSDGLMAVANIGMGAAAAAGAGGAKIDTKALHLAQKYLPMVVGAVKGIETAVRTGDMTNMLTSAAALATAGLQDAPIKGMEKSSFVGDINKYTGGMLKGCAVNFSGKGDIVSCDLNRMMDELGNTIDTTTGKGGYKQFKNILNQSGVTYDLGTVGAGTSGGGHRGGYIGIDADKLTRNQSENFRLGQIGYGRDGFNADGQKLRLPDMNFIPPSFQFPGMGELNIPGMGELITPPIGVPKFPIIDFTPTAPVPPQIDTTSPFVPVHPSEWGTPSTTPIHPPKPIQPKPIEPPAPEDKTIVVEYAPAPEDKTIVVEYEPAPEDKTIVVEYEPVPEDKTIVVEYAPAEEQEIFIVL